MTRTQMACYGLIASAFILSGLLVVKLQGVDLLPKAHADQLLTRANLTIMTARTRNDEESLFVMDNISQKLLIYKIRLVGRKGRLELARSMDLKQLFGGGGGADGGAGGGRIPR